MGSVTGGVCRAKRTTHPRQYCFGKLLGCQPDWPEVWWLWRVVHFGCGNRRDRSYALLLPQPKWAGV